jgi:hypothetical protein
MTAFDSPDAIDWSLTTWEGARREQMRPWAALPLETIVAALEEMEVLAKTLASGSDHTLVDLPEQDAK